MKVKHFYLFILVLLSFCHTIAFSHDSFLDNVPYNQKRFEDRMLFWYDLEEKVAGLDSSEVFSLIDEIQIRAELKSDLFLVDLLNIYKAQYTVQYLHQPEKAIKMLTKLLSKFNLPKYENYKLLSLRIISDIYRLDLRDYQNTFVIYFEMEKLLDQIDERDYVFKARDYSAIGGLLYYFKEYDRAIRILKKNLNSEETRFTSRSIASSINTIGLCYQRMGDYKKANEYFELFHDKIKDEYIHEIWGSIIDGNVGYGYYEQKDYDKAFPLISQDYQQGVLLNDDGRVAGAAIPLADIYIIRNDFTQGYDLLLDARKRIDKSREFNRLEEWYKMMNKYYIKNNNVNKALLYLDSLLLVKNQINNDFHSLKVEYAQRLLDDKETELKRAHVLYQNHQIISRRNQIIILLILISMAVIIVLAFIMRHNLIQKIKLKSSENKILKMNMELQDSSQKLFELTNLIVNKETQLKVMEQKFNLIDKNDLSIKLKKKRIFTNEQWNEFRMLFNEVYPGFIFNLLEKYPDLSPSFVRFLALKKMGLSNEEMAKILGVSIDSIYVTKHRICKKINISLKDSIEIFVERF